LKIFAARIHLVQMLESGGGMVIHGGMDGEDINARSGAFIAGHAKNVCHRLIGKQPVKNKVDLKRSPHFCIRFAKTKYDTYYFIFPYARY
jgi:hypothetical protein